MCTGIRFKDGRDIQSVKDFREHIGDPEPYKDEVYDELIDDCCLCQIDLEKFFEINPHLPFVYDCGEYWEI